MERKINKRGIAMFTNITSNKAFITVYEEAVVEKVPVKFVDYDGRIIKSEDIVKGSNVTPPPDPVREGYEFMGWNTKEVYNVIFNDYDGSVLKDEDVASGGEIAPPNFEPIRPGYVFKGWISE